MKTKTEILKNLFDNNKIKEAINIFATFKHNISKEDKANIKRGKDIINGNANLYMQLGFNCDDILNKCLSIINKYLYK